jgi:hypothetical protein
MTANEARARLNLPAIQDDPSADELQRPLNMASGGGDTAAPADPEDAADQGAEPPPTAGDDELAQQVAYLEALAELP